MDGVPELEADVDRLLDGLAGLGEVPGRGESSLEIGASIPQREARHRLGSRLATEDERLVPPLGTHGVVGESLDLVRQPVPVEPLDLLDDSTAEGASAIGKKTAVGHLLRQPVTAW